MHLITEVYSRCFLEELDLLVGAIVVVAVEGEETLGRGSSIFGLATNLFLDVSSYCTPLEFFSCVGDLVGAILAVAQGLVYTI